MLLRHKKEWNFMICHYRDGLRGYYAKWNKSDGEQQVPYDFTYMRNLKNKMNEQQNRNRLTNIEDMLMVAGLRGSLEDWWKDEEIQIGGCEIVRPWQSSSVS